ncbi:hypothetical protein [uncultured Maricaulis sp.]|uniref:hypothetical protein n=1 Tax=uncultured Maricaulis sp. TaxID=174710 RepID=UPI0026292F20|nr:hypothetical protein [uncultured Maricaulis sp.]
MPARVTFNTRLQNFCQKGFDGAKFLRTSCHRVLQVQQLCCHPPAEGLVDMAHAMDMISRRQPTLSGSGMTGCVILGGLGTTTMITTTTSWIRGAANVA